MNQPARGFDFQAFDDADGSDRNSGSGGRYANAERYLEDVDREERDGYAVEVKKPAKSNKAMPTSSGKKNRRAFGKYGHDQGHPTVEDIEEDINEEERDVVDMNDPAIESSVGHKTGITVSQSLGIDRSVDSLQLDEYDHIEVVDI